MPLPKLLAVASLHSHLANEQLEQLTNSLQGLIKVESRWVDAISRRPSSPAAGRVVRRSSTVNCLINALGVNSFLSFLVALIWLK